MFGFLRRKEECLPRQRVPHAFESLPDRRQTFHKVWKDFYEAYPDLPDPNRVLMFMHLVDAANTLEEGDYIELGVSRGMTLKLIHSLMDKSRTLYGIDSFKGFDARDIEVEKQIYTNDWVEGNFWDMSAQGVAQYLDNPANLRLITGWFPDAFAGLEEKRWRFVHIDMDLYQPIKRALEIFWPRLVPGGVLLVHDYGCYGFRANVAVDEFTKAVGAFPVQLPDRWGSVVFRKPSLPIE
jgi:O-methyltransferase